jgi:hypothetical protein
MEANNLRDAYETVHAVTAGNPLRVGLANRAV